MMSDRTGIHRYNHRIKPALVLIGLGNPGAQYERTRHNAGFVALDVLRDAFGEGEMVDKQKFNALVQEGRVGVVPILLVKPKTYMNLSGETVSKIAAFYKLDTTSQILILSDDIDLPLAELRFRERGGPGTHNGLKSIVDVCGEEFPRIRIGLGEPPSGTDLSGWVLSRMTEEEQTVITESLKNLPEIVREFVMGEQQ